MKKYLEYKGSTTYFPDIVSGLQDTVETNIKNLVSCFFTKGIYKSEEYLNFNANLKIIDQKLKINPGLLFFEDGSFFYTNEDYTLLNSLNVENLTDIPGNNVVWVKIKSVADNSSPKKLISNRFYYSTNSENVLLLPSIYIDTLDVKLTAPSNNTWLNQGYISIGTVNVVNDNINSVSNDNRMIATFKLGSKNNILYGRTIDGEIDESKFLAYDPQSGMWKFNPISLVNIVRLYGTTINNQLDITKHIYYDPAQNKWIFTPADSNLNINVPIITGIQGNYVTLDTDETITGLKTLNPSTPTALNINGTKAINFDNKANIKSADNSFDISINNKMYNLKDNGVIDGLTTNFSLLDISDTASASVGYVKTKIANIALSGIQGSDLYVTLNTQQTITGAKTFADNVPKSNFNPENIDTDNKFLVNTGYLYNKFGIIKQMFGKQPANGNGVVVFVNPALDLDPNTAYDKTNTNQDNFGPSNTSNKFSGINNCFNNLSSALTYAKSIVGNTDSTKFATIFLYPGLYKESSSITELNINQNINIIAFDPKNTFLENYKFNFNENSNYLYKCDLQFSVSGEYNIPGIFNISHGQISFANSIINVSGLSLSTTVFSIGALNKNVNLHLNNLNIKLNQNTNLITVYNPLGNQESIKITLNNNFIKSFSQYSVLNITNVIKTRLYINNTSFYVNAEGLFPYILNFSPNETIIDRGNANKNIILFNNCNIRCIHTNYNKCIFKFQLFDQIQFYVQNSSIILDTTAENKFGAFIELEFISNPDFHNTYAPYYIGSKYFSAYTSKINFYKTKFSFDCDQIINTEPTAHIINLSDNAKLQFKIFAQQLANNNSKYQTYFHSFPVFPDSSPFFPSPWGTAKGWMSFFGSIKFIECSFFYNNLYFQQRSDQKRTSGYISNYRINGQNDLGVSINGYTHEFFIFPFLCINCYGTFIPTILSSTLSVWDFLLPPSIYHTIPMYTFIGTLENSAYYLNGVFPINRSLPEFLDNQLELDIDL